VTEVNAGRRTAGIDGKVVLLASVKAELAEWVQRRSGSWTPKAVRRVYVVRRAALGCIPNTVGRNLEECFWV
jgi:RNA-directed DNA polymerase